MSPAMLHQTGECESIMMSQTHVMLCFQLMKAYLCVQYVLSRCMEEGQW